MPNTSPHNLYYPDAATVISPLHPILGSMQTSTEAALTTMDTAVSTATTNVATLTTRLNAEGVPWFATTGARDTALPTPAAGKLATTGTGATLAAWVYDCTAWVNLRGTDTGWLDISIQPGFISHGQTPQVRVRNEIAHFRGGVSGTLTTGVATWVATLPAGTGPVTVWDTTTVGISASTALPLYMYVDVATRNVYVRAGTTGTCNVVLAPLSGYLTV